MMDWGDVIGFMAGVFLGVALTCWVVAGRVSTEQALADSWRDRAECLQRRLENYQRCATATPPREAQVVLEEALRDEARREGWPEGHIGGMESV